MKLNLYDFLRAGHVKRWHIVQHSGSQTLAEHSFMVALIAIDLYQSQVGYDPTDSAHDADLLRLVMACLYHDMPEVRTGDLPTPAKVMICEALNEASGTAALDKAQFDEIIDRALMPEVPYIRGTVSVSMGHFVVMADVIEATHWINDHYVGAHAKLVAERIRVRMEKKIADLCRATGVDWYDSVNRVLMALGMPVAYRETDTRAL